MGTSHAQPARGSVLIVEADEQVAELVGGTLRAAGFEVLQTTTGAEGEALGEVVRPDLFIIDRTLPDIDGLVLTARLKTRSSAAIIVLGEHGRTADTVLGLKLGADDFIAQPFEPSEIEARVEAALRRGRQQPRRRSARRRSGQQVLQVGNLVVDLARKRVTLGDEELQLTPTELDLLTTFARNPEAIFSDEELSQLVWGEATPTTARALGGHIARLGAKLQAGSSQGPVIQRLEEEGYRLEPLDLPTDRISRVAIRRQDGQRIADPADRLERRRIGAQLLELAPDPGDVDLEHRRVGVLVRPGVLHQAGRVDHAARVDRQQMQQPELDRRQADTPLPVPDLVRLEIERQVADEDLRHGL